MIEQVTIKYEKLPFSQLSLQDRQIVETAMQARVDAYAPFSNFRVGAAALMNTGEIVSSSNQESEVYPLGICAERNLLYSNPNGTIISLAIISSAEKICFPCGACAQLIVERETRQNAEIKVIMASEKEVVIVSTAKNLLPFTFKL